MVSDKNVAIGYWPKELVPSLETGAGDVGWGGIAMAQGNENAPPLGSGQYPDGTYQHVGYFRDIHFMKGRMGFTQKFQQMLILCSNMQKYDVMVYKMMKILRSPFGVIDLVLEGLVVIVQLFDYSIGMYKEDFEIKVKIIKFPYVIQSKV